MNAAIFSRISSTHGLSLPEKYDPSLRPNNEGVADVVNVSIKILSVRDLNEEAQTISVDFLLQTAWVDPRLVNIVEREIVFYSAATKLPEIWIPRLIVTNSVGSTSSTESKEGSLKLKPDGTLDHFERVSTTLNCPMSFVKYPFGGQNCQIKLSTNGYSTIHLVLIWHGTISPDIPVTLPEYRLASLDQSSPREKITLGEFSYANVNIILSRTPTKLLIHAFLPCLSFAILSYIITFFLSSKTNSSWIIRKEEPLGEVVETPKQKVEVLSIMSNTSIDEGSYSPQALRGFDILKIAINSFMLLLIILVEQINFSKAPRSATITGLDVWSGMMGLGTFICFVISLMNCFMWKDNEKRAFNEDASKNLLEKVTASLRLCIPVLFIVFLILYLGFYLP